MTWFGWVLVVWCILDGLAAIKMIGKERPTTTPKIAMAMVIVQAAIIIGVLIVGTGSIR